MRSLKKPYRRFLSNLDKSRRRGIEIESEYSRLTAWRLRILTEGLISDLWQDWNNFSRTVLLMSCQGCVTRNAAKIQRRNCDNSWQRIGYEAKRASQDKPAIRGSVNRSRRQEPTWGDTGKLLKIIQGINPTNKSKLISAFGLSVSGPTHLQLVRNACAHKNEETIEAVRKISIHYISQPPQHPSELVWRLQKKSKAVAFYSWISDLQVIANLATLS